jgi:hypothetical protein
LRLFEAPNGPVLADFAENALASGPLAAGLACPVDFTHEEVLLTDTEKLCAALKKEMASLRPWYDLAVKDRGRTTVGVSGLVVDAVGVFVCAFWTGTCRRLPGKTFLCPMPSTWQQTI